MEALELLQAIQALGEQPKITVSVEVKRSIGQWESVTGSAFLTIHLPAGSTAEDVLTAYTDLNTRAHTIAEAEAEASVLRHMELARQKAEATAQEAATRREAQEQARASRPVSVTPDPERLAQAQANIQAVQAPNPGGRQLTRAPKANERQPGDWWYEVPTRYKLTAESQTNPQSGEPEDVYTLSFFKDRLEYEVGRLMSWQDAWPDEGWFDIKTDGLYPDNNLHALKAATRITLRVSEKVTSKGNHRVDVIDVQ